MESINETLLYIVLHVVIPTTTLSISSIVPLISQILNFTITVGVSSVPLIIVAYLNLSREKNQYVKILNKKCPCIDNFSNVLSDYRMLKFNSLVVFYVGIITAIITIACLLSMFQILIYYGEKSLSVNMFVINLTGTSIQNIDFLTIFTIINSGFLLISGCILSPLGYWIGRPVNKKRVSSFFSLTKSGKIALSAKICYSLYWLFGGIIFGTNFLLYFVDYALLLKHLVIDDNYLFNWMSFTNIYSNFNNFITCIGPEIKNIFFIILTVIFSALLSLLTLKILASQIKSLSNLLINSITEFYKPDFPYIIIKTESGEIKGQLIDIQNKYLISLYENNILKMVPWKKIEIIEVTLINKNEHTILDNISINEKIES